MEMHAQIGELKRNHLRREILMMKMQADATLKRTGDVDPIRLYPVVPTSDVRKAFAIETLGQWLEKTHGFDGLSRVPVQWFRDWTAEDTELEQEFGPGEHLDEVLLCTGKAMVGCFRKVQGDICLSAKLDGVNLMATFFHEVAHFMAVDDEAEAERFAQDVVCRLSLPKDALAFSWPDAPSPGFSLNGVERPHDALIDHRNRLWRTLSPGSWEFVRQL